MKKELKNEELEVLTWAEVDLNAVKNNLKALIELAARNKFVLPTRPKTFTSDVNPMQILAVIKADAYGHGVLKIAPLLDSLGVGTFGVSDVKEAIVLRKIGIKKPILLFESTMPSFAKQIVEYELMPMICTLPLAKALNDYAKSKNKRIDIHIKVDTGMGRLGVWHKDAYDFVKEIYKFKNLRTMGILTHFPAADTDEIFTKKQIKYLYDLVTQLDKSGLIIPNIHAANSMGLAGYETYVLNLARPGLMLYGLYPHPGLKRTVKLKFALSVKSKIIFLKEVKKGRSISYGRTFFTKKDMMIATIPIGYSDGYFRAFSNKACVLVSGHRCPVVGRVTMDQIMIDVSSVKNPKVGMPVVILGKQKREEISADELAKHANTINYEIVCSLGSRLPRVYK